MTRLTPRGKNSEEELIWDIAELTKQSRDCWRLSPLAALVVPALGQDVALTNQSCDHWRLSPHAWLEKKKNPNNGFNLSIRPVTDRADLAWECLRHWAHEAARSAPVSDCRLSLCSTDAAHSRRARPHLVWRARRPWRGVGFSWREISSSTFS